MGVIVDASSKPVLMELFGEALVEQQFVCIDMARPPLYSCLLFQMGSSAPCQDSYEAELLAAHRVSL